MIKNKMRRLAIKLFEDFDSSSSSSEEHIHYISDLLSDIYYDGINYKIWFNNIFFNRIDNKFISFETYNDEINLPVYVPILIEIAKLDHRQEEISDINIINDELLKSIKSVDNYLNSNSFKLVDKSPNITPLESYVYLGDGEHTEHFNSLDYFSKNKNIDYDPIWFICLKYDKK